jgi:hypothetical protein
MESRIKKTGPLDLSRRFQQGKLQQGAGSSGAPQSDLVATSRPAVETSAKSRDKPMVRHLPKVNPKNPLLGVSRTDTSLQEASTSNRPTAEGQGHLVSQAGGTRLAKKALSGYARRKLKKIRVRASKAGTGGIQQPENVGTPKQGETSTETSKRPRSEGSTLTEGARAPKRPRYLNGPGRL